MAEIIQVQSLFGRAHSKWLDQSGSQLVENSAFWNSYKVWNNYTYTEHIVKVAFAFRTKAHEILLKKTSACVFFRYILQFLRKHIE